MSSFLDRLEIAVPILQAPMAGVSTPEMAVAVSNAGGLGSIGAGAAAAAATRQMIAAIRSRTARPFNVNVFCNRPAVADELRDAAWLTRLQPEFAQFGAQPPARLREIYQCFQSDADKLEVLLTERPKVVSFHFGLPSLQKIQLLQAAGIILLGTATSLIEGQAIREAGLDAVVAQGYEAGGHRGIFNPDEPDDQLGTRELTRLLVQELDLPVIAAGGIMDGEGIAAVLRLGAVAAQLGTAFIACPESSAESGYRAALLRMADNHRLNVTGTVTDMTVMTPVISGRPARCLANRFTALGAGVERDVIPDYPIAYDAGKALHAAAKSVGEYGYGAQWAGEGACKARSLPVAELMAHLRTELELALSDSQ